MKNFSILHFLLWFTAAIILFGVPTHQTPIGYILKALVFAICVILAKSVEIPTTEDDDNEKF